MNTTLMVSCEDDYYFVYFVILLIFASLVVAVYNTKVENLLFHIESMETKYDIDSQIWEEKLDNLQEEYDVLKEEYYLLKEKIVKFLPSAPE